VLGSQPCPSRLGDSDRRAQHRDNRTDQRSHSSMASGFCRNVLIRWCTRTRS
jgi:hypothetical protein